MNNEEEKIVGPLIEPLPISKELTNFNQKTAKEALEVIKEKDTTFFIPTPKEKKNIVVAFAIKDKIVY